MEKIVEYFGTGLLAGLGAVGLLAIYVKCLQPGEVIYNAIFNFMNSICG